MGDDGGPYHYNGNLGAWLSSQRTFKKSNTLAEDRLAKLQILVDEGKYYQKHDIT